MKVSLLTDGIYPFVTGGMQKHSWYLSRYLAQNQIKVDLYHFLPPGTDVQNANALFTETEQKYIRVIPVSYPHQHKYPGHYLRESYIYSARLFDALTKENDADFIYAQGFTAWELLNRKRKGFVCAPVGVNIHGMSMYQRPSPDFISGLKYRILRFPAGFCLRNADYVFSLGGHLSDILVRLGLKDKVLETPIGIGQEWLSTTVSHTNKPRKFIFAGRYERAKGIEELAQVLSAMNNVHAFEFHFIGPIPEALHIKRDYIFYHGQMHNEKTIRDRMQACDILVCPSHAEGMPTVIIEAMASGLAVIATDVGACGTMVSEKTGWLIKPGDTSALKAAMLEALRIPEAKLLEKKIQANNFAKENLMWETVIHKTIDAIHAAVLKK